MGTNQPRKIGHDSNNDYSEVTTSFENDCHALIKKIIMKYGECAAIKPRPIGKNSDGVYLTQGGRDFDVDISEVPQNLKGAFGVIHRPGKYLFEVKWKKSGRLEAVDVAENIFSMQSDALQSVRYEGIVVLTNALIGECAYYKLTSFHRAVRSLSILDGRMLYALAKQAKMDWPEEINLSTNHDEKCWSSYQRTIATDMGNRLERTYVFYNPQETVREIELRPESTESWHLWEIGSGNVVEEPALCAIPNATGIATIRLGPWGTHSTRLLACPSELSLMDEASVNVPDMRLLMTVKETDGTSTQDY